MFVDRSNKKTSIELCKFLVWISGLSASQIDNYFEIVVSMSMKGLSTYNQNCITSLL